MTRLFHFSEDPAIGRFEPRPVAAARPPGREWLNGPLVWAIDEWHAPMYYFPRDCPRILLWPTAETTNADRIAWWGERNCRMIAHIEWAWLERLRASALFRYEFGGAGFEEIGDHGVWVSREAVRPLSVAPVGPLLEALEAAGVELRLMADFEPLRGAWDTTMHASGIRLRNAAGRPAP